MAEQGKTVRVPVHYIKSNSFRVLHADGAFGGVTGHGFVQIGFYSERGPFPTRTELEVDEDGTVIDERIIERRQGLLRELEASVVMDLKTAESVHDWLGDKIDQLRAALGEDGDG
jgi:hypothetical protein